MSSLGSAHRGCPSTPDRHSARDVCHSSFHRIRAPTPLVILADTKSCSSTGTTGQRVDKNTTILEHRWAPFVGVHGKSTTLPAGNYEYPFEYMFPGDSAESVEGIPEAAITYRLKATVGRGKLAYDLHAYKHLRLIRTLEPGALEYVHAMSVENIWPNKIEYSIVIPRKAVVFGGHVDVEMRFTPLLKGLELGDITIQMDESRETRLRSQTGHVLREHKINREVSTWKFEVTREECWRDTIEDTGQEGWVMTKKLNLPKKLVQCTQDVHMHGIKIRHKMKLTVALRNPDGHISEASSSPPSKLRPKCMDGKGRHEAGSKSELTRLSCEPLSRFPFSSPPTWYSTSKATRSIRHLPAHKWSKKEAEHLRLPVTANTFWTNSTTRSI